MDRGIREPEAGGKKISRPKAAGNDSKIISKKRRPYNGTKRAHKKARKDMSGQKAPGGVATSTGGFLRTYAATPDRAWLPCD